MKIYIGSLCTSLPVLDPRLSSTTPIFSTCAHDPRFPSLAGKTAIKYKTLHFALPSPSLPAKNRKCNKTESEKRPLLYQRPRPVVTLLSFPLPPSARNKLATFLKRGRSATSEIYAWKKAAVLQPFPPIYFLFSSSLAASSFGAKKVGGLSLLNKMEEALSPPSRLSLLLQIYPTSLLCHDFLASPFLSLALSCAEPSHGRFGEGKRRRRGL